MATEEENQPPTDEDRVFWQMSSNHASEIGRLIVAEVRNASPTTHAVELLKNRICGAMNSLWILWQHAPHDFGFDGMMVLRGMYDAHLQALYILATPSTSDERGALYLDYQWVEKRRLKTLLDSNPTLFARTLRSSPRRATAEPYMDGELDRVRAKYVGAKGKLRDSWYPGKLRALAREPGVDLESEYEILQRQLGGAVHSSSWALISGPSVKGERLILMGWRLVLRVLGRIAEVHSVPLTAEHREIVAEARRNLFDGPT